MTAYALLLRAVNVGGRSLSMAALRETLPALGYSDVATYVQSGNAVVRTRASAAAVRRDVDAALSAVAGFPVEVVVRSHAQLEAVVAGWPFAASAPTANRYVTFCDRAPDAAKLSTLPDCAPEELRVEGNDIYLWLPTGMGRSRLARLLASRLANRVATNRNWNTVTKLVAMTA